MGRELFWSLAGNAIVLALAAAAVWRLTGLGLHPVADRMLSMLSDASIPAALFALGLSLATYSLRGQWSGMAVLIVMKMVLMPILVFLALYYLISVPPLWAKIAILLAAMPTGANAFLFAHRNEELVPAVSGAVAVGTVLAAITVSLLLYLLDPLARHKSPVIQLQNHARFFRCCIFSRKFTARQIARCPRDNAQCAPHRHAQPCQQFPTRRTQFPPRKAEQCGGPHLCQRYGTRWPGH